MTLALYDQETLPPPQTSNRLGASHQYELLEPIGSGAMGTVWRARDHLLEVDVAIKVLRDDLDTPDATRRLLAEARAAARVRHRSAVTVLASGLTENGKPYIVMELLEGESLDVLLDRHGRVLRSFGERGIPGVDELHFNMPTDVAVAADGTFYVSDGYGNGRVLRFGADGSLLGTWGQIGVGPGQFVTPHGIAIGPDGDVYVADRGNGRVQAFSPDGAFLAEWKSEALGRPWSIAFGPDGLAYVVDGGDQPTSGPDRARVLIADEDGAVLSSFGSFGNQDGELNRPHDIAVSEDGSVYVVEVGQGKRAQKFSPRDQ